MGFWSSVGALAKQFAEYALAQKLAQAVPPVPVAPAPQPVPAPPPVVEAPPVTLEQRYGELADAIYFEILHRPTSRTDNGVEKYEACRMLADGKEVDLRRQLKDRA